MTSNGWPEKIKIFTVWSFTEETLDDQEKPFHFGGSKNMHLFIPSISILPYTTYLALDQHWVYSTE